MTSSTPALLATASNAAADGPPASRSFRFILALATAAAVAALLAPWSPGSLVRDSGDALLALGAGALAYRHATALVAGMVIVLPLGLFVAALVGLIVR